MIDRRLSLLSTRGRTALYIFAISLITIFDLTAKSADAQQRFQLDVGGSPIAVTLINGPVKMSGKFRLTSGEWIGDPQNLTESQIRLSGNLKDFRLDPVGNISFGSITMESLSSALPHKAGFFQSSKIKPGPQGRLTLEGNLTVDGKRFPVSVPVRLTRSVGTVEMNVRHSGAIEEWPNVVPLPIIPGRTNGIVEARLRFVSSPARSK